MRVGQRLSKVEKKLTKQLEKPEYIVFTIPDYSDKEMHEAMCQKALDRYPWPVPQNARLYFVLDFATMIVEDRFLAQIGRKELKESWKKQSDRGRRIVSRFKETGECPDFDLQVCSSVRGCVSGKETYQGKIA